MKVCSRCHEQPQQATHKYCKKCNAEYSNARYRKLNSHKPRIQELELHGHRKNHPACRMLFSARARAKRRGLECTLNLWDIVVPEVCPVLGIPLDRRDMAHSPSLDRFDNAKGYTPDNVRVISHRANSIKQDATPEELLRVANYAAG